MPTKKRILVLRLSALGDVALTVPVLKSLARHNPDFEFVLVSQGFAEPLVKNINGIRLLKANIYGKHKGIGGLWRLSREINSLGNWYAVADLHNVIRTKILRLFLKLSIPKQAVIDKGRSEKRALTRKNNKIFKELKHTIIRYADVFNKLSIDVLIEDLTLNMAPMPLEPTELQITGTKDCIWLGLAPFAKHKGKVYPLDKMKRILGYLTQGGDIKIFLFGGGKQESAILSEWEHLFPKTISLAGKLNLDEELRVMSNLDIMVSMDSANMHLASLVGVKVVSIWGATHPYAGFYGFNQPISNAIQVENLNCRPCSVFGNKPCFRKDYACLNQLDPENVYYKIIEFVQLAK